MTLTSEELVILVRVLAAVVAGALPEVLEFRIDPMGD